MTDMTERQAYFHKMQETASIARYLAGALTGCWGHPAREDLGFTLSGEIYTLVKELEQGLDSINLPEEDA